MYIKSFICVILCLAGSLNGRSQVSDLCITGEEELLFREINRYRKSKNLAAITLSAKLSAVAKHHVIDLENHYVYSSQNKCNPHSWSDKGNWTSCCYTNDHKEAECMWNKPREISGYEGNGYEIAFYHSSAATASEALNGWKLSKSHNELLINLGIWQKVKWKAIGIGIYGKYAAVWFGELEDESVIENCKN